VRFWCDQMLGKLARWLRILGYDTIYKRTGIPDELYINSLNSNRLFLTRSSVFSSRPNAIVLPGNTVIDHLSYLKKHINLNTTLDLSKTRCTSCNGTVVFLKDRSDLPEEFKISYPKIVGKQTEFTRCTDCGKIYWEGSHFKDIKKTLKVVNG